jgi:enoyl-[acyl-carrier protein] reductase I
MKVRVLVHSIAKGNLKSMVATNQPQLQHDDFQLTIDAMAISLYDWTKDLFTAELFAADARVLSFTSEGSLKAWKNYAAVSAAKAALEAISRSIALEMAPFGIRSNCLMAGVTDTASFRMIPGADTLRNHSRQRNPFSRLTTPEDVANVVYLLCKDEAAWINGAVIPVNGGEHLQ